MTQNNDTINKNSSSKILGIQFSILSPEEIRKGSVCQITSRDTYINNKPVINGLFDPRMGVLEPGLICPTDGLNYMQTPGYFGHIDLARPVFYIQYLTTIIKILRCTCVKCSKLLISKELYKHFLNLPPDVRWNNIFSIASKIKRCGEDTNNGCGCKQPNKIKKEGLATLIAEWDEIDGIDKEENPEKLILHMTPEVVLTQFKRISDEDITFMGFSPLWSRPEWMICQVLAVAPPAVRPSVKHDSQQRSEDDITHIIVNIIKTNKTLQDKININAKGEIIQDWSTLLQYHISTLVDNNIPGVAVAAQRSGRPLKSIKERLNGKGGRVRGNLMGKRVDFSARSVITPDPNLSINELGVPKKIALNLTRPVTVNKLNINFLTKIVQNGPDIYPGAKILQRLNGNSISLRYVDRDSIQLNYGDIVHRHIINGDAVLFNRQPTLHRMSMMCHIVRVMNVGDTFRMNVADTKPYNADFDGDEMNMHMPQDIESESELRNLAAVKWQIISPANNKSIVGIFQDSLLGSYRFTRENINFTHREAMNLLTLIKNIDINKILNKEKITSFDILSQILPPMSIKYKTGGFNTDTDDYSTSNNVLEIQNGEYMRGQMNKGVFGGGSVGLLQRLCNDFTNDTSSEFIDNLQNIVTEYMKTSSYSVGISDLIANKTTINKITDVIISKKKEVQTLIDKTHLGIFENKTGKTDDEEIETQINNILGQALIEAGKIGRNSLQKDNRFVIMVDAGSKGSALNISQMTSCVGQQTVDGKRIPYGFNNRTLPHYNKFDNSPEARGFVENSFISGLTPQELFFHAMGGRVGLIDTAVKTSQTGYIQRRLIKGMEDLKVEYDMTVRNNKNKIIQFTYGDDNFDTITVENQKLPLVSMSLEDIYLHFDMSVDKNIILYTSDTLKRIKKQKTELKNKCKLMIDNFIDYRKEIVDKVFNNTDSDVIHMPIAFTHLINNIQGQQNININSLVDITPLETFELIENGLKRLQNLHYINPNKLFELVYYYYLTPKNLLLIKKLNRKSITLLVENIIYKYKKAIVSPGEMVGMIAAQSIGEPTTQMTLNTFHFAGVASKSNVTRGVPRVEEILSLSENPKNPSCTIHLFPDEETNIENTENIRHKLEHTKLSSMVSKIQICFDPNKDSSFIEEDNLLIQKYNKFENMIDECNNNTSDDDIDRSKWIIRIELNKEEMLYKEITMDDIHFAIKNIYNDDIECIYSDYNDDKLIFRIRLINSLKKITNKQKSLDQSDEIYKLKTFQDHLLNKMVLRGVKNIDRVIPRKICNFVKEDEGQFVKKEIWVLDTVGTNLLEILNLDYIDVNRTYTNDIQEIKNVLGIEAARQSIFNEITEVMEHDDTYINYHHISLLCDRMTCNDKMVSIFRHGINNDNIGPIAKASFEETPEMFLKAARHAELDTMRGVSANVMCGQEGYFGTSAFQTMLDINKFTKLKTEQINLQSNTEIIENSFMNIENKDDPCSINNLTFENNIENLNPTNTGEINNYELDF